AGRGGTGAPPPRRGFALGSGRDCARRIAMRSNSSCSTSENRVAASVTALSSRPCWSGAAVFEAALGDSNGRTRGQTMLGAEIKRREQTVQFTVENVRVVPRMRVVRLGMRLV